MYFLTFSSKKTTSRGEGGGKRVQEERYKEKLEGSNQFQSVSKCYENFRLFPPVQFCEHIKKPNTNSAHLFSILLKGRGWKNEKLSVHIYAHICTHIYAHLYR